jgi:hypothetical protein
MAIYFDGKKVASIVRVGATKPTQSKTVSPSTIQQIVEPDSGYELSEVIIEGVTSSIDSNITSENIAKDVTILGVTGTFEGGVTPTGTLEITENGNYDVTQYASASVNVASSGGGGGSIETVTVVIEKGDINATSHYDVPYVHYVTVENGSTTYKRISLSNNSKFSLLFSFCIFNIVISELYFSTKLSLSNLKFCIVSCFISNSSILAFVSILSC